MKFTNAMRFIDTNVLLYSISTVPAEAVKAAKARGNLPAAISPCPYMNDGQDYAGVKVVYPFKV